jgi:hypothetical protein
MAPALYGVLFGIAFFVFGRLVPQPMGAVILWSAIAIQLSLGAGICWRRTGLPFASVAMFHGSVMSVCLVVLALMGQPFPNLAPGSWVFFAGGALVGPVLFLVESRVNRVKWAEWGRYMEHKSVWDILTGRHIPDLRDAKRAIERIER